MIMKTRKVPIVFWSNVLLNSTCNEIVEVRNRSRREKRKFIASRVGL